MVENKTVSGTVLLFLRLLGFVYLLAFSSFWVQIQGLIGSQGILPASELLSRVSVLGSLRYWVLPTVFWFNVSDEALNVVCALGTLLGALLFLGLAPFLLSALLWLLYLSIVSVGGVFMGYQWDNLLLETGLLSLLAAPFGMRPPRTFVVGWLPLFALRFLLFRLVLGSGLVKLLTHDVTWRSLTALTYHYETQPLPTWLGFYAWKLPLFFQKVSCFLMFVVELLCPLLVFGPRHARLVAFSGMVLLQVLIALTGNYGFFNILTVVLCLLLLDDSVLPRGLRGEKVNQAPSRARTFFASAAIALAFFPFLAGLGIVLPEPLPTLHGLVEPFRSMNAYGLFAVMTTERPEIQVEGSDDGVQWRPYPFRFKPGDLERAPAFVAPHQPRLDWQMWFAALGGFEDSRWFSRFLEKLLAGSPPVLQLLERDPFDGHPPRFIRAQLYRYHFSRGKGYWEREFVSPFGPVLARS